MIDNSTLASYLAGTNVYTRTDGYQIGSHTLSGDNHVVTRGPRRSKLGLEPATLEITVATGGSDGPLATFHADALDGTLDGAAFVYSPTYGTETEAFFSGTVQRVDVGSATVRIVAATVTASLSITMLPKRLIMPSCGFDYKSTECGASDGTQCGKSWLDCKGDATSLRAGLTDNSARFGGFREIPTPENYFVR